MTKISTNKWKKIEGSEMDLHLFSQLIFNKNANTTQWKNEKHFKKWCKTNQRALCGIKNTQLTPHTKSNSIWITDTNVKSKTIKLKLNICLPRSPAMPFLSIYVREIKTYVYSKTT